MVNESHANANQQYYNILVVGVDLNFAKQTQVLLNTLQSKYPDKTFRIFPASQKEKAKEYVAKYDLHSILIEDEIIDSTAEIWHKEITEAIAKNEKNKGIPVIIVTLNVQRDYTKKLIKIGYTDVLLKPIDRQLFIQKLSLLNKNNPLIDEDMLYSMDTEQEIDIAFSFKTKVISEYGIKLETTRALE